MQPSSLTARRGLRLVSGAITIIPCSLTAQTQQVSDRRLKSILQQWQVDLAQPCRIKALAATVHLCPRHLERLCQEELHMSLQQCLQRLRLERAAWLLTNSFLRCKEICQQVGFATDGAHFTRVFKAWQGCSPQQYRQKMYDLKNRVA